LIARRKKGKTIVQYLYLILRTLVKTINDVSSALYEQSEGFYDLYNAAAQPKHPSYPPNNK
jgi:hypothetical protein